MFKSLIAGVTALGLIATTAPDRAEAGDNDVLRGVIAGAIIIGTIAALDNSYKKRRDHSHSHSHVRVKPKYGHSSHNVYRHGTRIYSNRDNRSRHDNYGYRHRDVKVYKHRDDRYRNANRRNDDYRRDGNRNRGNDSRSKYHSHGDYRHKNHAGQTNAHKHGGKKHVSDSRKHGNRDQVRRLQAQKQRLINKNTRLQRQLDRRNQYVQNLRNYQQ